MKTFKIYAEFVFIATETQAVHWNNFETIKQIEQVLDYLNSMIKV
jgi:hypothetical protein